MQVERQVISASYQIFRDHKFPELGTCKDHESSDQTGYTTTNQNWYHKKRDKNTKSQGLGGVNFAGIFLSNLTSHTRFWHFRQIALTENSPASPYRTTKITWVLTQETCSWTYPAVWSFVRFSRQWVFFFFGVMIGGVFSFARPNSCCLLSAPSARSILVGKVRRCSKFSPAIGAWCFTALLSRPAGPKGSRRRRRGSSLLGARACKLR